jgi:hypothetical protein
MPREPNDDINILGLRVQYELQRPAGHTPPAYATTSPITRCNLEHRERNHKQSKKLVVVATVPANHLQQFGFSDVEYILFQNCCSAARTVTLTWTDAVTGIEASTSLSQYSFVVIPVPLPYDAGSGAGGIYMLSSGAPGTTTDMVAVVVGES